MNDEREHDSKARAYDAWQSPEARKLLDAYYPVKERTLLAATRQHGRGAPVFTTPEQWAGSLLVLYGGEALAALKAFPGKLPKHSRVRKLLHGAIEGELALRNGVVSCSGCDLQGLPKLDWRTLPDSSAWLCAVCNAKRPKEAN